MSGQVYAIRWRKVAPDLGGAGWVLEYLTDDPVDDFQVAHGLANRAQSWRTAPAVTEEERETDATVVVAWPSKHESASLVPLRELDPIQTPAPPPGYDPHGNAPFHDPLENTEPGAFGVPMNCRVRLSHDPKCATCGHMLSAHHKADGSIGNCLAGKGTCYCTAFVGLERA